MNYVDCHFHLDLQKDPILCAEEIEEQQIYTIAVTNSPKVFFHTFDLSSGKKYLRPALGLHPELAFQRKDEIKLFIQELPKTKYIGEVGLDKYRKSNEDYQVQKNIFEQIIISCAEYKNKIITVHSRWAANEVISMIGHSFPGKIILHWFSGSIKELDLAIKAGFYFSVNMAMTKSANGKIIIQAIPLDRLLTETDGPFIKYKGNPLTPLEIKDTVVEIAKIRDDTGNPEILRELVFGNFSKLLWQEPNEDS